MDHSRDQEGEPERTQPWVVDAECQRGDRNVSLFKTLFFGDPKSLQMVIAAMKLKYGYSLEGKL